MVCNVSLAGHGIPRSLLTECALFSTVPMYRCSDSLHFPVSMLYQSHCFPLPPLLLACTAATMGLTVVNVFGSFLAALVLGSAMLVQQSYLIQLLLKSKIPGLATVHDFTDNSKCYTIPGTHAPVLYQSWQPLIRPQQKQKHARVSAFSTSSPEADACMTWGN